MKWQLLDQNLPVVLDSISQYRPIYPKSQLHVKPFNPSTHVAPYWHGLLLHSFISEIGLMLQHQYETACSNFNKINLK